MINLNFAYIIWALPIITQASSLEFKICQILIEKNCTLAIESETAILVVYTQLHLGYLALQIQFRPQDNKAAYF